MDALPLDTGFRLLALSQVILITLALVFARPFHRQLIWLWALGLGLTAYFMIPLLDRQLSSSALLPLLLLSHAIPVSLWFSLRYVLEEDEIVGWPPLLLGAAVLILVIAQRFDQFHPAPRDVIIMLMQLIKLGFALASIWLCVAGYSGDLVALRRLARRWMAALLSALVAIVIGTELVTDWQVPTALESMAMVVFFLALLAFNLLMIRRPLVLGAHRPAAPISPTACPSPDDPVMRKLIRLMEDDQVFAETDLRIADLARRVGTSEHRLRRAINQGLGYRNFNRFVNHYRIREAGRRLLTTPDVPVLTIALDTGFRTLSVFNSAFRAIHGMSPTEYRHRKLTDSR